MTGRGHIKCFLSDSMKEALGDDAAFCKQLVAMVKAHVTKNMPTPTQVVALNKEIQSMRDKQRIWEEERASWAAERAALISAAAAVPTALL